VGAGSDAVGIAVSSHGEYDFSFRRGTLAFQEEMRLTRIGKRYNFAHTCFQFAAVDHIGDLCQVDTSKNPNSPQLGCNEINDLALARGAPGRVFRTLQLLHPRSKVEYWSEYSPIDLAAGPSRRWSELSKHKSSERNEVPVSHCGGVITHAFISGDFRR
jgi:hypothetical protein